MSRKIKEVIIRDDVFHPKFRTSFDEESVMEYLEDKTNTPHEMVILLKDHLSQEIAENPNHPLIEMFEEIKLHRNLKEDIDGWALNYYRPAEKKNGKYLGEVDIPRASIGVAHRIFLNLGPSNEILNLDLETPVGRIIKQIVLFPGEGFELSVLYCNSISFKLKNVKSEMLKTDRKGHRPTKIPKNPGQRHFLVLDGYLSPEVILSNAQDIISKKFGKDIDIKELANSTARKFMSKEDVGEKDVDDSAIDGTDSTQET